MPEQILAILSALMLLSVHLIKRYKGAGFLPSDIFIILFFVAWSPLTFFPANQTHLEEYNISDQSVKLFTVVYFLMCLFLSIGILISKTIFKLDVKRNLQKLKFAGAQLKNFKFLIISISVILISYYLFCNRRVDYLKEIILYLVGKGNFSYDYLRYDYINPDSFEAKIFGRLQYSVCLFLFLGITSFAYLLKDKFRIYGLFAIIFFILCVATMNKLPYFLYLVVSIWMYMEYTKTKLRSVIWQIILIIPCLFILIIVLYIIQYKNNPDVSIELIFKTFVFRVFRAYPDGAKMYIDLIPSVFPFTYGKTISLFQPFIGSVENPYILIPQYFGHYQTSFPSGFVADAYANGGLFGVILISFIVGIAISIFDVFILKRPVHETYVISKIGLGVSMFWLWSGAFTTSCFTGGLLVLPIFIITIEYCVSLITGLKKARYKKITH